MHDSDVFVLLLPAEVMWRPGCILEMHAAVSAGIPIVGCTLRGNQGGTNVSSTSPLSVSPLPGFHRFRGHVFADLDRSFSRQAFRVFPCTGSE